MTEEQLDTLADIEGHADEIAAAHPEIRELGTLRDRLRNLYRRVSGKDPWEEVG